ncbi:MAG TPA: M23 family peptidase, partial [Mycobacterium sp.]|nr:M23 family peptidase [Mycobacterium sp.]
MRKALIVVGVAAVIAGCAPSTDQPATRPTTESTPAGPTRGPDPSVATPLVAEAVAEPVAVPATDGKTHLAYEILLTNVLAEDVTLTSVAVLDRDVAVLDLAGDRLAHWTRVLGNPAPTTRIGPAQSAVVWLDVV